MPSLSRVTLGSIKKHNQCQQHSMANVILSQRSHQTNSYHNVYRNIKVETHSKVVKIKKSFMTCGQRLELLGIS